MKHLFDFTRKKPQKCQFFTALQADDIASVREMLLRQKKKHHKRRQEKLKTVDQATPMMNCCDQHAELSPLLVACRRGNAEMVRLLLENDANVGTRDSYGNTGLIWACRFHHNTVMEVLLETTQIQVDDAKDDLQGLVNACNDAGETALLLACQYNNLRGVQLLLAHHARVDVVDKKGMTPLLRAAAWSRHDIIHSLIQQGAANVNEVDENGDTPLLLFLKGADRPIHDVAMVAASNALNEQTRLETLQLLL
jgi:hypothetical protein